MQSNHIAVEIEKVSKSFGEVLAVNDLSLKVPQGCIYGLIGPNGSGKTTTMRMIMNIFYPDSGAIKLFGKRTQGAVFDDIGYLPEERGLYKKMTVREILEFYGKIKNGKNLKAEIERWLQKLDLTEWRDKKIEILSKGMSQKVQFIATVVFKPRLLILDEPFTGLDPVNMDVLREALVELSSQGSTVILSTHDMQVAEEMCDFICMIFKGNKVLDGTMTEIQKKYGRDTLRVQSEDDLSSIKTIAGIESLRDLGQVKEIRFDAKQDPQDIVRKIMAKNRVRGFEIISPSLHDIFVRIVRENMGVENA